MSITAVCCICIIMSFTSTYLMLLLRRHYTEKKQLFAHMKAIAGETKKKGIASANDLLNDAARVREMTEETTICKTCVKRVPWV